MVLIFHLESLTSEMVWSFRQEVTAPEFNITVTALQVIGDDSNHGLSRNLTVACQYLGDYTVEFW